YISDDTVLANRYISPGYKDGSIDPYLRANIFPIYSKAYILGHIISSPQGNVAGVNFTSSEGVPEEDYNKLFDILKNTNGKWKTPNLGEDYFFHLNFSIRFLNTVSISNIMFTKHTTEPPCFDNCSLSLGAIEKANKLYAKAASLISKEKYMAGIEKLNECIEIDPEYIDAYYNRAYAN
ncbi:unnamed protein product, partial [Scytosiphon promiscuus]